MLACSAQLPKDDFDVFVTYVQALQGVARMRLRERAEQVVASEEVSPAVLESARLAAEDNKETFDAEQVTPVIYKIIRKRAKKLIKALA